MRLLDQPVFPMLALLLLLFLFGAAHSALANRLGGPGSFYLVAQRTGEAFSVGHNAEGQLGQNINLAYVDVPQPVKDAAGGVLSHIVGVCAGDSHACVRRGNQVACSGKGAQLGLGYASSSDKADPSYKKVFFVNVSVPDDETSGVSNIMCTSRATFALNNVTGQAWAWGSNVNGVLGVGISDDYAYAPTLIPAFNATNKVIQIASGWFHACFLTATGKVLCSGRNTNGAIGINNANPDVKVNVPTPVVFPDAASTIFTSVSCGRYHACASTSMGSVYCWGSNSQGVQTGSGGNKFQPTLIPGVQDARFVWAGKSNVFVVLNNGSALAWGLDDYGMFGGESIPGTQRTPMSFARGVGGIQELQGGYQTTCIFTTLVQVQCVGENRYGQFGVGAIVPRSRELITMSGYAPTRGPTAPRTRAPAPPTSLRKRLAGLGSFYVMLQLNGDVFSVGSNGNAQLGLGIANVSVNFPQQVPDIFDVVDVSAGNNHACLLLGPGREVVCAGQGDQLGQGMIDASSLVFVPAVGLDATTGVTDIFCGYGSTFALNTNTGQAWAWGENLHGILGLGHDDEYIVSPTLIPAFDVNNKVVQIDAWENHACFLTAAGKVLCAGINTLYGMLGANSNDGNYQAHTPTAVVFNDAETTTFTSVSCGSSHTCASDSSGSVYCWGSGQYGQQLAGGGYSVIQPTVIPGVQDARFVWAGRYNVFVVLNDGTALAWGRDYYGSFGGESITYGQYTPMAFARGVGGIQEIRGGYYTACILNAQDQVQCVGRNDFGQLGVGPGVANSSQLVTMGQLVTQVPTLAPTSLAPTTLAPTRVPTNTPTLAPTQEPSAAPTAQPTLAPTGQPTLAPTIAPTGQPTVVPTGQPTLAPTVAPTGQPTLAPTLAPTVAPTGQPTLAPTLAPTGQPTLAPTAQPTLAPTPQPTLAPTSEPTRQPTLAPTLAPTSDPTRQPTLSPTSEPTRQPTLAPTFAPTKQPTRAPTKQPTLAPTKQPTLAPTKQPTLAPTKQPTFAPTKQPTFAPTKQPTFAPTKQPTLAPTMPISQRPTKRPTSAPTAWPTSKPTKPPTKRPTTTPTAAPTRRPTKPPTKRPTTTPTAAPTRRPTKAPSKYPTKALTSKPTKAPTKAPSTYPTKASTSKPTKKPTKAPTQKPTTKYPTKFPTKAPTSKPTVATG